MGPLLLFSELRAHHRLDVGGKAVQVARLANAGLPVPEGVVLPRSLFVEVLRFNGLCHVAEWLRSGGGLGAAAALRGALAKATLPGAIRDRLFHSTQDWGPVAVRSSGVEEDGAARSFAGQHDTVLEVDALGLERAIFSVWASAYSERVMRYRGLASSPPAGIAVLIQRMVRPRVSGVVFSINPVSGSLQEMVVESIWGLGEGLVSGQVRPHCFVLQRPRGRLRWMRSSRRLRVLQRDVRPIEVEWRRDPAGGVCRRVIEDGRRDAPTLSDTEVKTLAALALRVERLVGCPQDIEWAQDEQGRFWLLQTRPITSARSSTAPDEVLWTRRFFGERWPDPPSPLGWSFISTALEHYISYPKTQRAHLGGQGPFRLFASRPYANVTLFRHLIFKFPGGAPPAFLLEFFPRAEADALRARLFALPNWSVVSGLLRESLSERRWERFAWNPRMNHRDWDRYRERLIRTLPRVSRAPVSVEDAVGLVEEQRRLLSEYIGIHVGSLLFANLFYQLFESALQRFVPDEAEGWMSTLALCPPGNLTLAVNEGLWTLAQLATDEELDALESGASPDPDSRFWHELGEFLSRYGHRSDSSWEVFAPRWAEEPERLVPLLRVQRRSVGCAPLKRATEQERRYERDRLLLLQRLSRSPARRLLLKTLLFYTRRYLLLRENQRFYFDRLQHSTQRTLLWLGGALFREGLLAHPREIRFLTWPEVLKLADHTLSSAAVHSMIKVRRARWTADHEREPPVFLRGDEALLLASTGAKLVGVGISPGRVRGTIRRVDQLSQGDQLRAGEILLTRSIDPAWTPLFLSASGVILELGSRLSHGAVVAREYGLPAVVNIEGVLNRLRTGMDVTVDGGRGVVWIHSEGPGLAGVK